GAPFLARAWTTRNRGGDLDARTIIETGPPAFHRLRRSSEPSAGRRGGRKPGGLHGARDDRQQLLPARPGEHLLADAGGARERTGARGRKQAAAREGLTARPQLQSPERGGFRRNGPERAGYSGSSQDRTPVPGRLAPGRLTCRRRARTAFGRPAAGD